MNPEDERGICSSSDDQELLSSKMTIPDQQEVLHLPPHLQDDDNSCYESIIVMSYEWTVLTKVGLRRIRRYKALKHNLKKLHRAPEVPEPTMPFSLRTKAEGASMGSRNIPWL